jgi:hypothetical protein
MCGNGAITKPFSSLTNNKTVVLEILSQDSSNYKRINDVLVLVLSIIVR